MGIEVLNRARKRYYEELYFQETERQLFYVLFGILDESEEAGFLLDTLIGSPYAVTYHSKGGQSHVRPYAPGSGTLLDPPTAGEKTPITADLRDKLIAGVETNEGYARNVAKLAADIVRQHVSAINMQKNYQAMQVFIDGQFYAYGPGGQPIGLDVDFSRAAGNSLTEDFTDTATITSALTNALTQLALQGTPKGDLVTIFGANWQTEFGGDTAIAGYMQNNNMNQIIEGQLAYSELMRIEGMALLARYRGPGMIAPFWICSYDPPAQYVKDKGETASAYIGANDAVMFSLSDPKYRVNRGIDIVGDNGKIQRVAGDVVFDSYVENDPVAEYMRSQTRHMFVPANVNHIVKSTGTFA